MKIKDLLFNREKLRKYDELKATLKSLSEIRKWLDEHKDKAIAWAETEVYIDRTITPYGIYLTRPALDVLITALEAEIKKLDEE